MSVRSHLRTFKVACRKQLTARHMCSHNPYRGLLPVVRFRLIKKYIIQLLFLFECLAYLIHFLFGMEV